MKDLIIQAVDWLSIKLTAFPILGILTGITWIQWFSAFGIASTIGYNLIRIYKELKNKK